MKLAKVKVLTILDKTFKGTDGEVKCWEIVLQNEEDTSQVVTGLVYKVLDERVKIGESVEDVWVYEDFKGDRMTTKLFFPKKNEGGAAGAKPFTKSYGKSEAELKLARQELLFKMYSTHMSYVKDIMIATQAGQFDYELWYKQSKAGTRIILADLKEIQEG